MKAIEGHIYAVLDNTKTYCHTLNTIETLPFWSQCGVDSDIHCINVIDVTNANPPIQVGWIYDSETQTFSEPEPVIVPLAVQAQSLFNQYNYTPYQWNKLTELQQNQLTTYLDALSAIIDGTDTSSTELPKAPF